MLHERCVHIVDDEAKVRDALTLLLSTAQIESKSYGSAEEYLTVNPLEEPACILLDNQLPGMSGIELLRQIVTATTESAVIMVTAYGDVPTAVLAMKAGAFHFVQKPFDPEALLATVEEALSLSDHGQTAPDEMKEFKARQALLTQREREVLALLLEGLPTKLIADQLDISSRTAEHHRAAVIQKMQAHNISHLMRMAFIAKDLNGSDPAAKLGGPSTVKFSPN
jgi:two-component system response regulator FixJ